MLNKPNIYKHLFICTKKYIVRTGFVEQKTCKRSEMS
jgi:hypothetical protein